MENHNISQKSNIAASYKILFAVLVFLFFFIFYAVIHPLIPRLGRLELYYQKQDIPSHMGCMESRKGIPGVLLPFNVIYWSLCYISAKQRLPPISVHYSCYSG